MDAFLKWHCDVQCRAVTRVFHGAFNSIAWTVTSDGACLVTGSSGKPVRL